MHHHCLWQTEFLQLPQEVHPLLCSFCEDADVQPPLEVLADGGAQESEGLHNVHWGVVQGDGGGWGWVPSEVHNHLYCLQGIEHQVVLPAPGHQMVTLQSVGGLVPIRDESDEGGVWRCSCWCTVRREGEKEHSLGGDPVLMVHESETCDPSLTCCFLSDRKSVIHLQMESGTLSWESLS